MTSILRSRRPCSNLEEIFETRIQILATTLSRSTIASYRCSARRFLAYLDANFPRVRRLSQLRRDPHLLGWFRCLSEQAPPLSNHSRQIHLLNLRRLLLDLAYDGHALQPGLILPEDFPPLPKYLPRALSPEEDQRLQQELRCADSLPANALLLT